MLVGASLIVTACGRTTTEASSGPSDESDAETFGEDDPSDTDDTSSSTDTTTTTTTTDTTDTDTDTGPGDTEPPELIDGEFIDNKTVRLIFSEPIADVGGVDPAKFRMSSSGYYLDGTGTWYMDLGAYNNPPEYTTVTVLQNDPQDADSIVLRLSADVDVICGLMDMWDDQLGQANVDFVATYTESGSPDIEDLAGNELESIAAHWVGENDDYVVVPGFFSEFDPYAPIPCP